MLVFPCFPAIARRGFAKLVWPNLAKPTRVCASHFSQTLAFVGRNEKGGGVEAWTFATRKRIGAGVAKGAKPTHVSGGGNATHPRCTLQQQTHPPKKTLPKNHPQTTKKPEGPNSEKI